MRLEAQRRLKAAYEADKNTLRLADAYARLLDRHNDVDRREEGLRRLRSSVIPHHPLVVRAMADLDAGKTLAPVIRNAKDGAAEALYGLGGAGTGKATNWRRLIYLRLALFLRPDHDLAAVTVANLFEDLKRNDAAIRAYQLVPTSSPMRESAEIQAALELDSIGRADEAMTRLQRNRRGQSQERGSLERARKFAALDEEVRGRRRRLTTRRSNSSDTPDRSNWTLFYFRGICFERAKQWPKAEADFKKALELFPDQPLVLNYLGYSSRLQPTSRCT